jgi:copper chaperone NosL
MDCKILFHFIFIALLAACNSSPEDINYNIDECAYCKMKISDPRFGAELVTAKGKIFKYDSAECLINTYLEKPDEKYKYILVVDFSQPRKLINAIEAIYLISEQQPSPMGGDLSAYGDLGNATRAMNETKGELLAFDALLDRYQK